MVRRCVALLSGGLDSMLAVRLMQEQEVEVEALNFKTIFTCCQDQSAAAAAQLGVRLTVIAPEDSYLELIRSPRFGYGRGANPCIDCRIYMFERAKEFMRQCAAQFVVSGEIVGQRPMSQKRNDLEVIAYHAGLEGYLLRPLSARLLPPTVPEREGWVDRARLHRFYGRSRKGLIRLAKEFGLPCIPTPSNGCALTEVQFSRKVYDLIYSESGGQRWDFELLKLGRHFRFDPRTKVVIGRNADENAQLVYMYERADALSTVLLEPQNFVGPAGLLVGSITAGSCHFAAGLVRRHAKPAEREPALVRVRHGEQTSIQEAHVEDVHLQALNLASDRT